MSSAERAGLRTKGNVPTLRFPEFKDEWDKDRVRNLFTMNVGGDIDKANVSSIQTDEFKYPVIANALSNDGIYGYTSEYKDDCPSITVTGRGDVGLAKYRDYPLFPIVRLLVLHSKGKIDCRFGEHAINCIKKYEESTGVPQLTAPQLGAYSISFPNLTEQAKIGAFLKLIDDRIATQIRIIEKLQSLMKGLNDYLQDSVPLSYSLSFSDIGEDYSGLSGKSAEDFGSGKPYITYVSIYANNFVEDDCCGKVSVKRDEKQNVVQKGDMLFTLSSETPEEVCYGAVYSGNSTETYLNSFCFGVRNTEGKVFSPYMAYFFNSNRFRREVYPLAQGSTRFNLQKSDFLQKHFSYPSIDDQHRIFEILNAYDNKLKVENQILVHYQHQKEFLLRNLFI